MENVSPPMTVVAGLAVARRSPLYISIYLYTLWPYYRDCTVCVYVCMYECHNEKNLKQKNKDMIPIYLLKN